MVYDLKKTVSEEFKEYIWLQRPWMDGFQTIYRKGDVGASVVLNVMSYGNQEGLVEVMALKFDPFDDYELVGDAIGHQDEHELSQTLDIILNGDEIRTRED